MKLLEVMQDVRDGLICPATTTVVFEQRFKTLKNLASDGMLYNIPQDEALFEIHKRLMEVKP